MESAATKGIGNDEDGLNSGSDVTLLLMTASSLVRLCSGSGLNGDDTAPQDGDAPPILARF